MAIAVIDIALRLIRTFDVEIDVVAATRILLIRDWQRAPARPAVAIRPEPHLRLRRKIQVLVRVVDVMMPAPGSGLRRKLRRRRSQRERSEEHTSELQPLMRNSYAV